MQARRSKLSFACNDNPQKFIITMGVTPIGAVSRATTGVKMQSMHFLRLRPEAVFSSMASIGSRAKIRYGQAIFERSKTLTCRGSACVSDPTLDYRLHGIGYRNYRATLMSKSFFTERDHDHQPII